MHTEPIRLEIGGYLFYDVLVYLKLLEGVGASPVRAK